MIVDTIANAKHVLYKTNQHFISCIESALLQLSL